MRKWLLGGFGVVVVGIVSTSVAYPQEMAIALATLVIGFGGGMLVATTLMETYFGKGADMAYELQKKQIINPVSVMKEVRLSEKAESKPEVQTQTSQAIPRFSMSGLVGDK